MDSVVRAPLQIRLADIVIVVTRLIVQRIRVAASVG